MNSSQRTFNMRSAALYAEKWPAKRVYTLHAKSRPQDLRCRATRTASREAQNALDELKQAIEGTSRGIDTPPAQKSKILEAVATLEDIGRGSVTTASNDIDSTWKLLWTTEKETLFILKNAKLFGTKAADVYQVIDTASNQLQNVITFENGASFVVDSNLQEGGEQRLVFKFTGARLNLPSRTWKIPPFGKGWFDTIYLDETCRVAKDIRGDTLVVQRDGPPRKF